MISATTTTTATTPGATPSATPTAAADSTASQDRFLKLLVAQLNNQDPMNPMDNAQMTTQMAQINTVTGIEKVNATLQSMAAQFASLQVLQGASMVGRDVMTEGSKLSSELGLSKGAIDLAGSADSVKIEVLSPGGQLVDTLNLGALPAGRHFFESDTSAYKGTGELSFRVTATGGGKAITATPMARDKVISVSSEAGALSLQTRGNKTILYSDIKAIL